MEPFFASYRRSEPWFAGDDREPTGERRQSAAERQRFTDTAKCNLCAACTSACPVFWNDGDFFGPSGDRGRPPVHLRQPRRRRRAAVGDPQRSRGGRRCRTTFNCTQSCPRGIQVTQAVQQVKRAPFPGGYEPGFTLNASGPVVAGSTRAVTVHQTGEIVAGFRIDRLIGSGGMGEVYLVHHPRLPRLDALKLLPVAASSDHSYRERFQREADLAAGLDHDNVVTVYDRGEADGQLWIHMKYVAGQDAAAALRTSGPFSTARALHVITRVASALDDAHRHGLLHRDVKPANILLGTPTGPGEPERVYLTDFGIAKGVGDAAGLTPSGHFAASLDYAAPEQIQVQPLDGRCDQYALGCVLFQLLTGAVPYPGDGAWARMNAHLTAPVPRVGQLRPGLPLGVQSVLDRAMAKAPKDRFESCGAMAAAFADALRAMTSEPPTTPAPAVAAALPAPRPPDLTETPPPGFASPWPPTAAEPAVPLAADRPDPWWRHVDRAAGACAAGARAVLSVLSLFPPTSAESVSRFPGSSPPAGSRPASSPRWCSC